MRNWRISLHPLVFGGIVLAVAALVGIGVYYIEQQQISSNSDASQSTIITLNGQIATLKSQLSTQKTATAQTTAAQAADQAAITKVLQQFDTALVANQTVAKEKAVYPYLTPTALSNRATFLGANPSANNMVDTTTTIKAGSPQTPQIDATDLSATVEVTFTDNANGFARVFKMQKQSGKWLISDITGTLNGQEVSTLDGQSS